MTKNLETIAAEGANIIGAVGGLIHHITYLIESDPTEAIAVLNRMDTEIHNWSLTLDGAVIPAGVSGPAFQVGDRFARKVKFG